MATINLGSIKFKWQGAYNAGTAYTVDDVVSYNGSSYICILASTGNLPTNATYWNEMAKGSDLGSISGLAQGDIIYYDGSNFQRLGAGTSGQALLTGGTGANPSWGDVGGGLVQFVSATNNNSDSTTSTSFVGTSLNGSITPTSASNKILISIQATVQQTGGRTRYTIERTIGGGASSDLSGSGGIVAMEVHTSLNNVLNFFYYDEPNTTSSILYRPRFRCDSSSHESYWNAGSLGSRMTLMEVAV